MINDFAAANPSETSVIRQKAAAIARQALWKNFIRFYESANTIALQNVNARAQK